MVKNWKHILLQTTERAALPAIEAFKRKLCQCYPTASSKMLQSSSVLGVVILTLDGAKLAKL